MRVAVSDRPVDGSAKAKTTRIPITVAAKTEEGALLRRTAEPVTIGLPFPSGVCVDARLLTIEGGPETTALQPDLGAVRPLQARVLDRWPDGSIRWALLDFQADTDGRAPSRYDIVLTQGVETLAEGADPRVGPKPDTRVRPYEDCSVSRVAIAAHDGRLTIDTGAARFVVAPRGPFPFESVVVDASPVIDSAGSGLFVESAHGESLTAEIERVAIEEQGPLRSTVRCEGTVRGARGTSVLQLIARLHFFAGSATVRVALTIRNPQPARHPGGCWPLGERGSQLLRDVSLRIALAGSDPATPIRCSPERDAPYENGTAPFELYQDSSGSDNWRSTNHKNRDGVIPLQFRGYRLRKGTGERSGHRASPVVSMSRGGAEIAVAMPHFWENFPKAIEAGLEGLTLRLFPRQSANGHEIQGGEQKTHTFFLAFDRDRVTPVPLDWCRSPLLARADPAWYCASGAVPYLLPAAEDPDRDYVALTQSGVDGHDTFARKAEKIDEYGWRNFGDLYADHEAVFQTAGPPLVSHYNNQYDGVAGFAIRFLRSADARWWTLMDDLASHVADIDVYHTAGDKAAYNHGLFWHTYHYVDAATSTHRSYPTDPTAGGGPSAEHNYPAGLLLHYYLTGNPMSRETAVELAQWVIDMDDGSQTVFRWLDRGATGLASMTGSPLYHGPGRGAANSIVALLTGHRATRDAKFLAKAEALIRRSVHPEDDLVERNLLDAERRWFYTVFLQALGKYLDYKVELGELDGSYAYGRASLLHYAAWMVEHEYPYLDRPEILEYPTETWAAQDMRKSDVFAYAAKHSTGEARTRLLERADFFFQASVSKLSSMPTRTLTRPVVLMLTNGLMHAGCPRTSSMPAPSAAQTADFGAPESFVPQKTRAMKRARLIAAAMAATTVIAAAAALLSLL